MFQARYLIAIFAAIACAGFVSDARAQPARTFVATYGSDGNPCSVAAPCRTLGPAITAVATGGDVLVLDSGGFGQNVDITKSVNIIAEPGIIARVRTTDSSYGLQISGSGISVKLNGIGVTGTNGDGIYFTAGKSLEVRNAEIDITNGSYSPYGIWNLAPGGFLTVDNVVIRNAFTGILVQSSGTGGATIVNSVMHANRFGIGAAGTTVTVRDTTVTGKSSTDNTVCTANFTSEATSSGLVSSLRLDNVVSTNCFRGVLSNTASGGVADVAVSNSLFTGNNQAGALIGSGTGRTYLNNRVFSNMTNTLTGYTTQGFQ